MGVGRLDVYEADGRSVAAGSVLKRNPVDMPINEDMGE